MKNKELYNRIMKKCSVVIKKQLNESFTNMTYGKYCQTYNLEQRCEIEKMLCRIDLIDPKYIENYVHKSADGKDVTDFLINTEDMSSDEISNMLVNMNWKHKLMFIDINESYDDYVNIFIPHVEDSSLVIEYTVSFNYYPGSQGDYYTPSEPDEVEVDDFEINDAYIQYDNGEKVNLNMKVKNANNETLEDVLYNICTSYSSLMDDLQESYKNGRW